MLLFDEAEDTTDTKSTEDGAKNLKILTDTSPSNGQNHNSSSNYDEIEQIPAIFEVVTSLSNNLQNGFNCEDNHEGIVENLKHVFVDLRLHVPVEAEDESVQENTNHDEQVKVLVLCDDDHKVTGLAISGLEAPFWFGCDGNQVNLGVTELSSLQVSITLHDLFL